jgi:hypothetical protein
MGRGERGLSPRPNAFRIRHPLREEKREMQSICRIR